MCTQISCWCVYKLLVDVYTNFLLVFTQHNFKHCYYWHPSVTFCRNMLRVWQCSILYSVWWLRVREFRANVTLRGVENKVHLITLLSYGLWHPVMTCTGASDGHMPPSSGKNAYEGSTLQSSLFPDRPSCQWLQPCQCALFMRWWGCLPHAQTPQPGVSGPSLAARCSLEEAKPAPDKNHHVYVFVKVMSVENCVYLQPPHIINPAPVPWKKLH